MIKPIKSLGQNYLKDKNILRKIINAIDVKSDDLILEIGPGTGALTEFILEYKPQKLIAVDVDERVKDILKQRFDDFYNHNFYFYETDIREFKIFDAFNLDFNKKIKVCGNIPYYLTADIIFYLIENRRYISTSILMIQKEVAQRIVSKHNNKTYGILSVILQLCSDVKILFNVSPKCFYPQPKVSSAVIEIDFFEDFNDQSFNDFILFVKTIFNKRRKIIKNNLEDELRKFNLDINDFGHLKMNFFKRAEELSPMEIYNFFKEFDRLLNSKKQI